MNDQTLTGTDLREAAHQARMEQLAADRTAAREQREADQRRGAQRKAVAGVLARYRDWSRPDMTKRAAQLSRRPGGIRRPAELADATNWELGRAVVAYDPLIGVDRFAVSMRLLGVRRDQNALAAVWHRARKEAGTR